MTRFFFSALISLTATIVQAQMSTGRIVSAAYLANYSGVNLTNGAGTLGAVPQRIEGFGFFYQAPIKPWMAWEIGLLRNPHRYQFTDSVLNQKYVRRFDALEIPITLQFQTWTKYIYYGGGVFIRQSMGSIFTKVDDGSSEVETSFTDTSLKPTDYGLQGLISIELPVTTKWSFSVGGRYNYSLANASTLNETKGTFQSYYMTLGLRMLLGSGSLSRGSPRTTLK